MTVIWSNMQDDDCKLLQKMWEGLDNVKVIEITPKSENWETRVNKAIENEHETILFAGHGTRHGLLFPNYLAGEYILHENNVDLINAKNVICVWCHASTFCENHDLHAFATGMFISNLDEAQDYILFNADGDITQDFINNTALKFYVSVNALLYIDAPLHIWRSFLYARTDPNNTIDEFNRLQLYYSE